MFHATSVELNVGDCLLPSEKNGKIYGTKEDFQCLIFGRNNDSLRDLGSLISTLPLKNGKLGIKYEEHFPNIFELDFKDKIAFVYQLEDADFVQGEWQIEYYKKSKAKIVHKKKINLYDEIMKNVKLGNIEVQKYSENKEYVEKVINHLLMQKAVGIVSMDKIISTAKQYKAKSVQNYFEGLKEFDDKFFGRK